MGTKDFNYYTFLDEKKCDKKEKKLEWNVIDYDFNKKKIQPINLFDYNITFLKDGLLYAKKHYSDNFEKFSKHVRSWLQYEFWSRSEYEVIVSGWPGKSYTQKDINELQKELDEVKEKWYKSYPEGASVYPDIGPFYKLDVYTQVMLNWPKFIKYVWENKKLITKLKLGLDRNKSGVYNKR